MGLFSMLEEDDKAAAIPIPKLQEMSKAELRRRAGLSPATLTKLRRNAPVSMEVLMKIAEVMDCNIGDMMDFVKENA